MDRFNRKSFQLGEDTFFIQLIPPKESIKAWTEVQKILLPALSGAMEGMNLSAKDEQEHWVNVVASACQTLPYTLDAEKVEKLYSYLLNPEYIAVQRKDDKTPIRLSEDLIDEMSEVWESLRMDMQAKDLDLRKNMSESFNPEINLKNLKASADAESPTAEAIDATIAPMFDRFKDVIDYEQVEEKLVYEDISKALYGSGFLRFYLNFAYYYNLYCRQNGMAQALTRELRIDEAIPFFPMAKAQELRRLVRQCFLALRGRTANEMFENLIERMARGEEPNGEEMLDLAEKLPDESMQGIVVSFVMVNFETEGIEIFNEKLYWQLKGLEFEKVATLMDQLLAGF